eukprot:s1493_g9.t1
MQHSTDNLAHGEASAIEAILGAMKCAGFGETEGRNIELGCIILCMFCDDAKLRRHVQKAGAVSVAKKVINKARNLDVQRWGCELLRNTYRLRCSRWPEYLPASLLPLAREEYGKVIARVLQCNRADAWNTDMDTDAHRKARRAWLEFFMFGKCVLRQSQRDRRPAQVYRFTESLLYRWRAGDRYDLWTEAMVASERRSRGRRRQGRVDDVHREVERLVSLGRVGEATRRLVSLGLASETPAVKARLLAKFPARDEAEMVSASCV